MFREQDIKVLYTPLKHVSFTFSKHIFGIEIIRKYLNLRILVQNLEFNILFNDVLCTCFLNDNVSSNMTPKSLILLTISVSWHILFMK